MGLEPSASGVTGNRTVWQQVAVRRNLRQLLEAMGEPDSLRSLIRSKEKGGLSTGERTGHQAVADLEPQLEILAHGLADEKTAGMTLI